MIGPALDPQAVRDFVDAVHTQEPVSGFTHNFYRYPARFSPRFAAAAIECFSEPGDIVLDPYMGGGTTVVEALAAGRRAVGNDLNSLGVFVTRVKTTPLRDPEIRSIASWANEVVPSFSYRTPGRELGRHLDDRRATNLTLVRGRFIKKAIAAGLASIGALPTRASQAFVRCAILRVSQWALDGRRRHTPLHEFRAQLKDVTHDMLQALHSYFSQVAQVPAAAQPKAILLQCDASQIDRASCFSNGNEQASLVVTSPPYPGVHVLYHRWQVDGRRETPAPYWISGCNDGEGGSFYNFGDRREQGLASYFRNSLRTLMAIRRAMRPGGHMVQMIAFTEPEWQFPRYLHNMETAGFREVCPLRTGEDRTAERIWRWVPGRKWHAAMKGATNGCREVVLVHKAV